MGSFNTSSSAINANAPASGGVQLASINTLIESPVEGNVGVGFAVPINVARESFIRLQANPGADA